MTRQQRQSSKKNATVWVWAVALLVIAFSIYAIITSLAPPTSNADLAREVRVSEAAALRDEGALILDVREPDEWNAGHIPEATFIPLGQLESRLSELPQDQKIVVVCRSGNRSATGRDILLEAGFTDVTSMSGGMNSWSSSGLPMVTGP